ncbi:MAG: archease [Sedimentisphaerales bacterium]|nr:archease [Sedimentisphaerales bacterium]
MNTPSWQHYSHPADMGIRGLGRTKNEAFAQAALALTAIITDPAKISPTEQIDICCEAQEQETLFVDWLNAIIYEMATRQMLFNSFTVKIKVNSLTAKALGEKIDVKKHQPAVEVKAATYMDLKVQQTEDGKWVAQCIVDV